jgi:hypothetical protein
MYLLEALPDKCVVAEPVDDSERVAQHRGAYTFDGIAEG